MKGDTTIAQVFGILVLILVLLFIIGPIVWTGESSGKLQTEKTIQEYCAKWSIFYQCDHVLAEADTDMAGLEEACAVAIGEDTDYFENDLTEADAWDKCAKKCPTCPK